MVVYVVLYIVQESYVGHGSTMSFWNGCLLPVTIAAEAGQPRRCARTPGLARDTFSNFTLLVKRFHEPEWKRGHMGFEWARECKRPRCILSISTFRSLRHDRADGTANVLLQRRYATLHGP